MLVKIDKVNKNFAGEHALKEISFEIPERVMAGLIGADGAGKSTLMRIITTLTKEDSGTVSVLEFDTHKDFQKIRSIIGYMPQKFSLYQDLSVLENINFFADIFGIKGAKRKEQIHALLHFARLEKFTNRRAGNLSGGMKQKLALCCALIHEPSVLILDEPTTGVDPVSRNEFWEILSTIKNRGTSIILSTPYMDEASNCDILYIIDKGNLIAQGTPADLLKDYHYSLYKIVQSEKNMTYVNFTQTLQPPLKLIYPSEGSIRIVLESGDYTNCQLEEVLKIIGISADSRIEKVSPTIEDLFFMLLSDRDSK